ncbi:MAG: hypothetical protein AAGB12_06795 [Pseudomonadota bacterium]
MVLFCQNFNHFKKIVLTTSFILAGYLLILVPVSKAETLNEHRETTISHSKAIQHLSPQMKSKILQRFTKKSSSPHLSSPNRQFIANSQFSMPVAIIDATGKLHVIEVDKNMIENEGIVE